MIRIGRNINSNDTASVTTYELNGTTAKAIALPNDKRIHLSVSIDCGIGDACAFIRLYPAAADSDKKGDIIQRRTSGNDALFLARWVMTPDNIYRGEISAITDGPVLNVHVTEY